MLQRAYTYRWCWVPFLTVLFLLPQLQQHLHRYEQSAHLESQWHCESDKGQFHLHDTEHYGAHHCDLCQFVYQSYPLSDVFSIASNQIFTPTKEVCLAQQLTVTSSCLSPPGRAPPSLT